MSEHQILDQQREGFAKLLANKKVLVTVGAGGVGKTTTAAALGIAAVKSNRKTLVLTIDPARRLAASLGLETLDQQDRAVDDQLMKQADLPLGKLHAMMLDQKRTFDEVISRHAADQEAVDRILKNKLYRELSSRLAGGQEYAAMEKLHEVVQTKRFDLLVLDTPPTVNAFDFLEAPKKMVDLLDSAAVKLFVSSYETAGKLSFKLLSMGSRFVFKRIARFVGGKFLDDLAEFFADMHSTLPGFGERAAEVTTLLASDDTGFIIITSPDRRAISQATLFYERLKKDGYPLAAFIINRVHPQLSCELSENEIVSELEKIGYSTEESKKLKTLLQRSYQQSQALAQSDRALINELKDICGEEHLYLEIPMLQDDVHSLKGLAEIASYF